MSTRTLLGVWAHPDDEAYLSAGLMARSRQRGDRVVVVTATSGEHGTSDPIAWPPARLAARRRRELHDSLAAVGVHELHVLGFEDGDCMAHDGTAQIVEHILDVEPDVIVTFGPDGVTGHPDHRAVSRWTTDAWAMGAPTAELWYPTFTENFHETWGMLNRRIDLWADQPEPPCTHPDDLAEVLALSDDLVERKFAALRAHESQTAALIDLVGPATFRQWWRTEYFRRVDPAGEDDVRVGRWRGSNCA